MTGSASAASSMARTAPALPRRGVVDSSVRYIVTDAVLLLAVSIDSLARRTRTANGRG